MTAHLLSHLAVLLDDGMRVLSHKCLLLACWQEAVRAKVVHLRSDAAGTELALVESIVLLGILGSIALGAS